MLSLSCLAALLASASWIPGSAIRRPGTTGGRLARKHLLLAIPEMPKLATNDNQPRKQFPFARSLNPGVETYAGCV